MVEQETELTDFKAKSGKHKLN